MNIADIAGAVECNAVPFVFVNVLLQQLGLPVPAVPTLLLAGSLVTAPTALAKMLGAAIVASLIADWVWYGAGRAFGYRVLAGLCRLSINPGSCVTQTEARFVRWGMPSLVVAKFIPGFPRWRRPSRERCGCRCRGSWWRRASVRCCGPGWPWAPAG